ncbi:MAG: 4-(cytidine 5'-diphospho)-2-C-methyl-D-erythritol kinase [Gammaproteobacteria bacterium]|nr:MAG: 4-(cytidine 5'-diphospho)-2-C-methyl-D-erythritol kinase [Gammaproteobacteria bacterium]
MPDFDSIDFPAPAKLNLFLHITGRRKDGFHQLQSVFQFLDLCDTLRFRLRDDGQIKLLKPLPGVPAGQNLVARAAILLQRHTSSPLGADISLQKRLPLGGGLGGGSSDAATTLVVLNRLWGCGLGLQTLLQLGCQLGADVPVFVAGEAAWAEGIGEDLRPLSLPEPWYLVLAPGCHVSTREIFEDPDLTRNCPPITIRAFLEGQASNVCQPVVVRHYPEVAKALEWLGKFTLSGQQARMTGSGGCVFAAFEDEGQARDVMAQLPAEMQQTGMQVFVAKGMNHSPLHELLQTLS